MVDNPTTDYIMSLALGLCVAERRELLALLQESLEPGEDGLSPEQLEAAWHSELQRRIDAVNAGAPTYSLEEVLARLRSSRNQDR